jgi:tetratricopeptide (TPR) repeat protein
LANELDDLDLRLSARFNQATLLHVTGAIRDAAEIYTGILTNLTGERELDRFSWPGNPSITTLAYLTRSLAMLGEFERARQTASRATAIVDRIQDREAAMGYSKAYAYWGSGVYQSAIGQVQAAIDFFEAANVIARHTDIAFPLLTPWLATAYAQGGRASDALALLLQAEEQIARSSGSNLNWYYSTHHYLALAQSHVALGAVGEARSATSRAQEIAAQRGEPAHLAQVFQLRGRIEAADSSVHSRVARDFYERAIELGRPRGLRPLVAQCLAGMAEAWQVEGDVATAADYRAQAQRIFDELKVLSSPSL